MGSEMCIRDRFMALSFGLAGCSMVEQSVSDATETPRSLPSYPVDPSVHVSGVHEGPVTPGAIRPLLPNAVAYARYGLGLLRPEPVGATEPLPEAVLEGWVKAAEASAIPPMVARAFAAQRASEEEQAELLMTCLLYTSPSPRDS